MIGLDGGSRRRVLPGVFVEGRELGARGRPRFAGPSGVLQVRSLSSRLLVRNTNPMSHSPQKAAICFWTSNEVRPCALSVTANPLTPSPSTAPRPRLTRVHILNPNHPPPPLPHLHQALLQRHRRLHPLHPRPLLASPLPRGPHPLPPPHPRNLDTHPQRLHPGCPSLDERRLLCLRPRQPPRVEPPR